MHDPKDKEKPFPNPFPADEDVTTVEGFFDLSRAIERERGIFDCIAVESSSAISGGEADLFLCDYTRSTRDPLYGESVEKFWIGPYHLNVYHENPESSPSTVEQGFKNQWDVVLWIPRVSLEEQSVVRAPDEGDVVQLWNIPFFNSLAVNDMPIPKAGLFFSVEKVNTDAVFAMSPSFGGFKLYLKRRSEFTPERRLTPGPTPPKAPTPLK